MFHVFQSNSMHVLVDQFVHRTTARSLNPFQAQTVVVQSFGMGQWLKIRQAEQHGIAANMQCILPANLVWQLYRSLLTDLNLPIDSPFSIERMTWHLVQLLPQFNDSSFAGVRHFLAGSGDPQIRHYQLAEKIATLFDQYLIYRPDWILGWETDSPRADIPASWQKDLWRALNQTPQLRARHHRARLHRALLARLEQLSALPDDLPQQVSVIGLSSLPRIHLDTLQALSRHIDVDLYFLNPCQHYWGDIVSEKDLARRSIRQLLGKDSALADDDYLTIGNPLLSSLGKQGREYLELLLETEAVDTFDHFAPPAGNLMLARVKRDLLQLEFGGQFGSDVEPERTSVEPADLSIQIHVCHSKLREVEVLFDQLLRIIDRTPHITPADIIVMMPDVSDYAPFIEAVFPRDTMPYTIADRKPGQESAVLVALTALLSLPESRLTSIEVMDLLEVPIISRRLGLTEDDLLTLSRWIADSGIRWELDGPSKSTHWQLPAVAQNTWQFGLDRLLLGYAMDADAGLVHAILPLPVAADEGSLLGTLCHFVDLLATWRAHLAEPRAATDWRATVSTLIDDFFAPEGSDEKDLAMVRELLIRLTAETAATDYQAPLSAAMFGYWLNQQLAITPQSRAFISGGVTFATLVPMRSIPFRVVCLLGMNDGQYPREDRPPTFDLMQGAGYRKGDRSKRNDDRYLFLEALLSADDCFYISYEGRGIKDNKERPASVVVGEFTDYLGRIFEQFPQTQHPLQPFSEDYYRGHATGLTSYRREWFEASLHRVVDIPFADAPLDVDADVTVKSLQALTAFFRNPASAFLRTRLGVYFEQDEVELQDTESFEQDGLSQYQLTEGALDFLRDGQTAADWQAEAVASGRVMQGDIGNAHVARSLERATALLAEFDLHAISEPTPVAATINVAGRDFEGIVEDVYDGKLIRFQPGQLHKRQLLAAWIQHLFVTVVQGPMQTIIISRKQNKAETSIINAVSPEAAREWLTDLVQLSDEGLRAPLPFLPETSFAYAAAIHAGDDPEIAFEQALSAWQSDNPGDEGDDRNYRRLFDFPRDFSPRFCELARRICDPLAELWEARK